MYPGNRHLFADDSLSDYDEGAATLLEQRVLSFLGAIEELQRHFSQRTPESASLTQVGKE